MIDGIEQVMYAFVKLKKDISEIKEAGPTGKNLDPKLSNLELAILVLAGSVLESRTKFDDSFGHEICFGIRKGLYGSDAGDNRNLADEIIESNRER